MVFFFSQFIERKVKSTITAIMMTNTYNTAETSLLSTTKQKYVPSRNMKVLLGGALLLLSFGFLCILDLKRLTQDATDSESEWARMARSYEEHDENFDSIKDDGSSRYYDRPTNLRIAFVGDSVTRYMYLAFVHFLKHGRFVEDEDHPNILNAKHFPSWNDHFNYSTHALAPNEECDCFRYNPKNGSSINKEETIENRYYADPERNNYVSFIQIFGGTKPHGHWNPSDVHSAKHLEPNFEYPQLPFSWRHDWGGLIRDYLAQLEHKPEYLLFNEGLWVEHELGYASVRQSIKEALDDTGIVGIYKTTTLPHINSGLAKRSSGVLFNRHDDAVCDVMDGRCLDLTWTKGLGDEHYWDLVHFKPHVNKVMVLQFLDYYRSLVEQPQKEQQTQSLA